MNSPSSSIPQREDRAIPLDRCEDRGVYQIYSRNLTVGVFNKATRGFIGIREKFGSLYLFEEYHYDAGPPYGTVHPLRKLDAVLPEGILLAEYLPSVFNPAQHHGVWCTGHDREVEFREDVPGVRHGKWFHLDDGSQLGDRERPGVKQNQPLYDFLEPLTDWVSTYQEEVAAKRRELQNQDAPDES